MAVMSVWRVVAFAALVLRLFYGGDAFPAYYDKDEYDSALKELLEPAEVQSAMCNIVTDQIKATANATITRQLKGVCHAKEVKHQLRHIETVITRELFKIHRIVQTIANQQNARKPVVFRYLPQKP